MRAVLVWSMAAVVLAGGVLLGSPAARAAAPGELIGLEPRPDGFHGVSGGYVVDYWTADGRGGSAPASGGFYVPPGEPPAGGWPVIAYDHGTTGLGPGCGGQSDPAGAPYRESQDAQDVFVRHLLDRGFAVVAPDYLGLGRFDTGTHPYLGIDTEATATIDLLRAVRSRRPDLSATWAVAGMSQGGQAALGTGHRQATYAPELDFRGTIALDPESDVEKVATLLGPVPSVFDGNSDIMSFAAGILAGLRAAHPEAEVDSYLTPRGREVLDTIGELCLDGMIEAVTGLGFPDLLARPLSTEPIRSVLDRYMRVPTAGYDAPILLLANAADVTVPSPLHAALAAQFVAGGVDFATVVGTGRHCAMDPAMWAAVDEFLARRF